MIDLILAGSHNFHHNIIKNQAFIFCHKIQSNKASIIASAFCFSVAMQDGKEKTVQHANRLSDVDTDHVKEQWNVCAMKDGKVLYVKSLYVTTIV